jgi:hypothetical protein
MIQFSQDQKHAWQDGAGLRREMVDTIVELVENALQNSEFSNSYPDAIISGTMGIGKTYNAEKELKNRGIEPIIVKGNQSIANLAGALMVYHHRFINRSNPKPGEKLIIMYDDCDSLFESSKTINILKAMTGAEDRRVFQHNVQVNKFNYSAFQQSIMDNYAPADGSAGIHVPCDDMVFIFTTNLTLPTEKEAKDYLKMKGQTSHAGKKMDLAAVRRRVQVRNFVLPKKPNWGWLVEVALNDGGLDILPDEMSKMILLDWMWNNWDNMTETNLSTLEKMAIMMIRHPDNYRDKWERAFINHITLM